MRMIEFLDRQCFGSGPILWETGIGSDPGVKKQKFNWFPEVKCKRKDLNNTVPVHNILLFFYEITQYTHFG